MIQELLGPNGSISPNLVALYQTLMAAEPFAILNWLRMPQPRKVLAAIGAAGRPLDHELLDSLQHRRAVDHIRAALVADGVLPERDEKLEQLIVWSKTQVAASAGSQADLKVLSSYLTWHHLRRLRRQSEKASITNAQAASVRREIKGAVAFLSWMNARSVRLSECTQSLIDDWLATADSNRYFIRTFITWSAQRHSCPKGLSIPITSRESPKTPIEQDLRWQIVRKFLHDNTIDTSDRVAGLLVLLFGQQFQRIVELRKEDVSPSGETILLGQVPVALPPPLDALTRELADRPYGRSVLGRTTQNPWLFPGARAEQPLNSAQVMARLQRHGLQGRPARNATLMDLANQLPAVVLSKLLGIHLSTATKWTAEAGQPASDYASAVRGRRTRHGAAR
ncbi:hypothetical protein BKG69_15975 [Mycobacteroides chelonae]|nr:hypothetical protein BKG69_15975 [Mycobacteroides chelonae]